MNKGRKTWLMAFIYIALIVACIIAFLVGHFTSPRPLRPPESSDSTQESSREAASEDSSEPFQKHTPSDAIPITEGTKEKHDRNRYDKSYIKHETEAEEIEETQEETEPEPEAKPSIIIASDLHYYPSSLTDYGEAFQNMVSKDDGKLTRYVPQIMDAFIEEVVAKKPTALVLSGDLALNGERAAHEELAEKLRPVQELGIQVLIIPGNHDINKPGAASYFGKKVTQVERVDAKEFYDIYREFGYDQAISRDENSLSYLYPLDAKNWMLMLDSCQYETKNLVAGRIKKETLAWMEIQLNKALEEGINVIPAAHHNLLKESILYPLETTMENSEEVIRLLESYRIPVLISGHLHLQRIKKYKPEPGEPEGVYHIAEIVSDAITIPPCQYGYMQWTEDGELHYTTQKLDMSAWAKRQESQDENLLQFAEYGNSFLSDIIANQIYEKMHNLPEEQMLEMARLYADLNRAYCAGMVVHSEDVRTSSAFRLWERNLPESKMYKEIDDILRDTKKNHNSWIGVPEPKHMNQQAKE